MLARGRLVCVDVSWMDGSSAVFENGAEGVDIVQVR